jgi:hypothetical protein
MCDNMFPVEVNDSGLQQRSTMAGFLLLEQRAIETIDSPSGTEMVGAILSFHVGAWFVLLCLQLSVSDVGRFLFCCSALGISQGNSRKGKMSHS